MRRFLLVLLALTLPLAAQSPRPKPKPNPKATAALPISDENIAILSRCEVVPIYAPSYLPAGYSLTEVDARYKTYTLGYKNKENCSLWVEGSQRDRPADLKMGKKLEGEVQIQVKHPTLGAGKLCWLPRIVDPTKTREEYAYGVLAGKSNVSYDVGTLGPLSVGEVQKFMQGLVLLPEY